MRAAAFTAFFLAGTLALPARGADPAPAGRDDFNATIRPILARHCFKCHGPDDRSRKARLRLDVRDLALRRRAIVPGKPDDSELIARIFAEEDSERMPPPGARNPLSEADRQALKKWVAAGADTWRATPITPSIAATPTAGPFQLNVAWSHSRT